VAFDGGDYRLDFCNGVARVVVFFAARAAAVFVVDMVWELVVVPTWVVVPYSRAIARWFLEGRPATS
jgi:hypothetical protein